jgi:hypothetical protein
MHKQIKGFRRRSEDSYDYSQQGIKKKVTTLKVLRVAMAEWSDFSLFNLIL